MKRISVTRFAQECLSIINAVHNSEEPVLITTRGKPFARLLPAVDDWVGHLEGTVKIKGDIESPIVPPDAWKVLKRK
jgi:prevent-host-death family protein